jgi:hypothetical protein
LELDEQEKQLINAIRFSNLTPQEYLENVQKQSVNNYIENQGQNYQGYSIDNYSDDDLYIMDLISRSPDITEEEAVQSLALSKQNEVLFKKRMDGLRNEYKKAEEESLQYSQMQQQEEAQNQYNQFAEKIENQILNFKEFSGCQLNMNDDEMEELYNFITGYDSAGNSWFSKALSDPKTVVEMAWFALNGEKMISDITDYYQKEITKVRKESYDKGLKAKGKTSQVTYKPKDNKKINSLDNDDIDY